MKVADAVATSPVTITADKSVREAIALMKANKAPFLIVVDKSGQVSGIAHALDLHPKHPADLQRPVAEVMRSPVPTIASTAEVRELHDLVQLGSLGPFVVLSAEQRPVSLLVPEDLVRIFAKRERRTETMYRKILDQVDEGIVAVDPDGLIALFNSNWLNIHQVTGEQVLGQHIGVTFPESSLVEVLQRGEPLVMDEVHFHKTGASVRPHYQPIFDDDRNIIGSVAVVKNLANHQGLAHHLRNLQSLGRQLAAAFDNLSEGVVAVDGELKVVYANPAYCRILCTSMKQAAGKPLENLVLRDLVERTRTEVMPIRDTTFETYGRRVRVNFIPLFTSGAVQGALGVIEDLTELRDLSQKLTEARQMAEYLAGELVREQNLPGAFSGIMGQSGKLRHVLAIAARAATTSSTVLLLGENGVGKELVAKAIHYSSPRKDQPFICINCSAIPDPLLESELFGYEDGAFTGARRGGKPGKFELANRGTLFLDEVGDMSPQMQAKVLRVLQEMEIERVGSTTTRKLDVRILAATNRGLKGMVEQGQFREDLFYRINVVSLTIPPLRERPEDILPLAQFFIDKHNQSSGRSLRFSPQALRALKAFDWPGNVRELQNVVELATVMVDGEEILMGHLPPYLQIESGSRPLTAAGAHAGRLTLTEAAEEAEKQAILAALEATDQNRSQAMKILGVSRRTFYNKLNQYFPDEAPARPAAEQSPARPPRSGQDSLRH